MCHLQPFCQLLKGLIAISRSAIPVADHYRMALSILPVHVPPCSFPCLFIFRRSHVIRMNQPGPFPFFFPSFIHLHPVYFQLLLMLSPQDQPVSFDVHNRGFRFFYGSFLPLNVLPFLTQRPRLHHNMLHRLMTQVRQSKSVYDIGCFPIDTAGSRFCHFLHQQSGKPLVGFQS